ncbi:MAG: hypothetical protein ABSB22_24645, partial [Thermodesulfobacteriota bacterium]
TIYPFSIKINLPSDQRFHPTLLHQTRHPMWGPCFSTMLKFFGLAFPAIRKKAFPENRAILGRWWPRP